MLKILDCMYFCTVMLSTQYSIGAYQTFNVTRVELIRIRHIPKTRRALKESIRKRIFGPVHIHLDVTVRVTNQIPTIYPIISIQSSIENYAKMCLESRRLSPYLFTCDVTHSLSFESH